MKESTRAWLVVLSLLTCASATAGRIDDALIARMRLMPAVAQYKATHHLPIEDRSREAMVINGNLKLASSLGLEPDSTGAALKELIELAKSIQRHSPTDADGPSQDLDRELRPAIDRATHDWLLALSLDLETWRSDDAAAVGLRAALAPLQVTTTDLDHLVATLRHVQRTPPDLQHSTLDFVRARAVLRVGTTGDYPPFSDHNDNDWHGIDIDFARALGKSLDAEVEFVPTSWKSLTDDLANHRFDIAMSGVSRQAFRQLGAMFSAPYFSDGKSAIARCEDATRFARLTDIDQANVRVLVNSGGTNQRFVESTLHNARVDIKADNKAIFDALAAGEGDVMITDRVEIEWQSRRHAGLCAALGGELLTHHSKGWLMPRDPIWVAYVNQWLEDLRDSGDLDATFNRYLPPRPARAAPAGPRETH